MGHRSSEHISDDRLVDVCLAGRATRGEEAHLAHCGRCDAKRSRLESLLREIGDTAQFQADAAFPDERLAAQHARILQRIDHDGRPARVITFPASTPAERPLRTRPASRWIAGAAAAGLAIGLLAGHLVHDLPTLGPTSRTPSMRASNARPSGQTSIRAVNATFNEQEFIDEIENALDGPTLAVLRPLNELTP